MSPLLGKIHFWGSLISINGIFMPMFFIGMAGVSRRLYDQTVYAHGAQTHTWQVMMSWSAWVLFAFQLPFIYNMFTAWKFGKKVENDNPWEATTIEWAAPSPPPHGNFTHPIEVYREAYQYDPATHKALPQFVKEN